MIDYEVTLRVLVDPGEIVTLPQVAGFNFQPYREDRDGKSVEPVEVMITSIKELKE